MKSVRNSLRRTVWAFAIAFAAFRAPAQTPQDAMRTDIFISGVYPHLTTYGVYSQNGGHFKSGHNEFGIGAIVPWAGKLWMVNYAPHMPRGSEHKLYSVDPDLSKPLTIHPESVGGTPAGRMIHEESNQLLIAHYLIDASGGVRVIQPADMPIRVTAIARHLEEPENKVYYIDMEGSIWEANAHTLAVERLFKKPVPGWHAKGGYTSQGRLVIANNGELSVGDYSDVLVGGAARHEEERGVLAEWDGDDWRIVERRQYTEVTGPRGITGGSDGDDPIWSVGWDRRSVRLKLLEDGRWYTYLLPKAAYCNDASHGWYTEWPRIREITKGRWMMDMHGMFFNFPKSFSRTNSKGLSPIGSHLRYIPDFCGWNGRVVLATDETSIQGNPLAGQPQSNLWFGGYEDLKTWGPASGYGGPWVDDAVDAGEWSDPFLVAGFERRMAYLAVGQKGRSTCRYFRTTNRFPIESLPSVFEGSTLVTIDRGAWRQPAPGFSFEVDRPVTVYLVVDRRGDPRLDDAWELTDHEIHWDGRFVDRVYRREFAAGEVAIPGNPTEHEPNAFGAPHAAFVKARDGWARVAGDASATVTPPRIQAESSGDADVVFSIQVDIEGTQEWTDLADISVPSGGAVAHVFPDDLEATWMRFKTDRDCVASAFLHQTSTYPNADGASASGDSLFDGLADIEDSEAVSGRVYPAKRNRNLRLIAPDKRFYEFSKRQFEFSRDSPDDDLAELLHVEPEFAVDAASAIIESRGQRFRLPKGNATYDKPFASGWPRALREVESERELANIHGTFYEVPLITNGAPPAWNLMRPVSTHGKRIHDFCSWNGLLVLSGIAKDARNDGHVFRDPNLDIGLWLGAVDDLWKFGKPVGVGGPWKATPVRAGAPSDAYLMRGYDRKSVAISHSTDRSVRFTLEVDFDGAGRWIPYQSFDVAPDKTTMYQFPDAFSAFWIRAISDTATTATVEFEYR